MLSVKGLSKWQHYKRRNPPWIKLYHSVLLDYDFSRLTDEQKFHLMALWSLASVENNRIPDDVDWIKNRIGAKSTVDIDALIKIGFVFRIDDTDIADVVDVETQEKQQPSNAASRKTALPYGFYASDRVLEWALKNGHSNLDVHLASFVGKCRAKGYQYVDWDSAFMEAIRADWAGVGRISPARKSGMRGRSITEDLTDRSWAQ